MTHPLVLGSLKSLNGDRLRHHIMYQTPPDVVTEFLRDDVGGGGQFLAAPLLREDKHVIRRAVGQVFCVLVGLDPHRL